MHRLLALTALLPILVLEGSAFAQEAVSSARPETALLVEVLDSKGRSPLDPALLELKVLEDGQPVELLSVTPPDPAGPAGDWTIVVYLDYLLSQSRSIQRLADILAERSEQLTALGEVTVVVADPQPRMVLPGSRDPEIVQQVFDGIFARGVGSDELRRLRTRFVEERQRAASESSGLARDAMKEEIGLLRRQQDELIAWLAERGPGGPRRALLLLNDALGIDPLDFYLDQVPEASNLALSGTAIPDTEELAETLAAYNWIGIPTALAAPEAAGRFGYQPSEDLPIGFRLKLGGGKKETPDEVVSPQELGLEPRPVEPLRPLAVMTGGEVLTEASQVEALLGRLAQRITLRYRTGVAPDGALHRLEVRSERSSFRVRSPSRVGHASPEAVAEVRVRRSLQGELDEGDLVVESAVTFDPALVGQEAAQLEVEVPLSEPGGEPLPTVPSPIRVTVGVHLESDELLLRHEVISEPTLSQDGRWIYRGSLILPTGSDAALVVVELLTTGDWGISFADLISRVRTPVSGERAAGEAIRILPPDRGSRSGRVIFRTSTEPRVQRVVFLLDGERVVSRKRPPFEASLDAESLPRRYQIVAVAYGEDGRELDRDGLIVNQEAEDFWLRIVEPRPGPRVGPVDIEVNLHLPDGGTLDRVEFFWKDRRVATLRQSPFRHRLLIPVSNEGGYIRVAAKLSDGSVAEDLVLMNAPGFGMEIGVRLVELYVVVLDRNGVPVRGLQREQFRVREEKAVQEIESFAVAGDLPLTVGLAIDSSSSLFLRMPEVQRAAKDFVQGLITERDRAFLVAFGGSPSVVRATTGDLDTIIDDIGELDPRGSTAVWEAIALSLTHLHEVPDRKALVVFYDGDDEDPDYSYQTCLSLARKTGIPIYLIVMNNAAARTQGRSLSTRSFVNRLDRLAQAGGGRVYFVRTDQDLGEIFSAISEELRSHYLLTYYPRRNGGDPRWRPVQVEITEPGLSARTISGYALMDGR